MNQRGPRLLRIEVECADALTFPADVLVLKHAQGLYGLDQNVVEGLQARGGAGSRLKLPRPGDHRLIGSAGIVAADNLLFIGTAPLPGLDYKGIRALGKSALAVLGEELPSARHVVMTVHGPGFGLDEVAAFEAQLAGMFEALEQGAYPTALEQVTIVESRPARAQRLRRSLESAGPLRAPRLLPTGGIERPVADELRAREAVASRKGHVFVAMPFAEKHADIWELGIYDTVRAAGLLCERIDQDKFTGDILTRIKQKIDEAQLMIAVLTDANPNVYLEVGYAWGRRKPTILLVDQAESLRFDVQGQRCLIYSRIGDLKRKLADELAAWSTS